MKKKSDDVLPRSLLVNGREIGFGMRNLGNPVWGHELSWIVRYDKNGKELKQALKIIKKALELYYAGDEK